MKDSKIEWTDHTFNPWIGCTRVSPGCVYCYAEQMMDKRLKQVKWGVGQPRKRTSAQNWNEVRKWNEKEKFDWHRIPVELGRSEDIFSGHSGAPVGCEFAVGARRPRVFCASLADWLDPEVPVEWLADLLALIHECPNLDFLLLTKRPELWAERIRAARGYIMGHFLGSLHIRVNPDLEAAKPLLNATPEFIAEGKKRYGNPAFNDMICGWLGSDFDMDNTPPPNVWIGTTVEDHRRADERHEDLMKIPARVHFWSSEPLLSGINAAELWAKHGKPDWVICGGESGPGARPMHPEWARSLRNQCDSAGVPFFFKQWGEWAPWGCTGASSPPYVHGNGRGPWAYGNGKFADWIDSRHGKPRWAFSTIPGGTTEVARLGKNEAGRLLDGREHSAFPEVRP